MEQIKRMLVNQRGFIVQALKQMTEANTANREVREKFVDQIKVYIYIFFINCKDMKLLFQKAHCLRKID